MLRPDDLRGRLFPAVPVPLTADGRPHQAALRRYVAHLAAEPIGGVAVWAHTGRGLHLGPEARAEVLSAWRRGLGDGRPVIAAAGAPAGVVAPAAVLEAARGMAAMAADLGADALLVYPPTTFRGRGDADSLILDYHAAVAEAGLPLVLFWLYEAAGGVAYGPELLASLLGRPEVLGIKVATLNDVMRFQELAALVRDRAPDKVLVSGEDRFLGYSLMCGAEAALVGMGAACAGMQAALVRSHRDGDAARFLALNGPVDDLGRHAFTAPMEGYILRMLWCLVHQGIIPAEAAHDPWGPRLDPAEAGRLRACLARIGQLEPGAAGPS
jgi:4-hydroxy-tetrahydrodipicolinate synthase